MKTVDLFNLYVDELRPDPPWSEYEIGGLTVRLTDDYDAKVPQLAKPAKWVITEQEAKRLPPHKGTWQATATVSWKDSVEKSILLDEECDDDGLWDLCNLLTFITGRSVVTAEYKNRYRPDIYGDSYAAIPIETLKAAALAWQNRENLVSRNLHIALTLYNEAMNANLLQARAALNSTALNIILDNHETAYEKVSKKIRKELKNKIINILKCFEQTKDLQPDQVERYRRLLHAQIDRGPASKDKLLSLLQSLEIVDSSPTPNQEDRVQDVDQVRNRLVHTGLPKIKGLDNEQSKKYTAKIAANVVPEIIRIVIGHHLGFRSGGLGSYSQIKYDLIEFFHNGVLLDPEFRQMAKYGLTKNRELYQRLS